MSGGTILLIVLTLFFIIGVTVGIITVVAISTLRKEKERARVPLPSSARSNRNVSQDPAGPEDGIDDQDPGVSGVPGHWDGPTEDPGTSGNRHWWDDDSESSSLS